jgi:protein-disulfide isomerase
MSNPVYQPKLVLPVSERDHSQGPADAPVTLVEYGDFECPYCGRAYPIIKELQRRIGDRMCLVFRNFPITTKHPHAMQAAEAAESAGGQGKFWEMHDTIYENQQNLEYENLITYAEALKLDMDRFKQDLAEHTYLPKIEEDFRSGVRSGVNGTPTFFINSFRYDGEDDIESLQETLLEAGKMQV